MFLRKLQITSNGKIIRDITFKMGLNLIVDDTSTDEKLESGNNVGKTSFLKLIHFCLGGDGKNIYKDSEFANEDNKLVKSFLTENNVVITLEMIEDFHDEKSKKISISKNFLLGNERILEINGEKTLVKNFNSTLKKLLFGLESKKPSLKQIVSKNIRYTNQRLSNTLKVLDFGKLVEYEALYLYWFGIEIPNISDKQRYSLIVKSEETIQKRLKKEGDLPKITQSINVINREIEILQKKKDAFEFNDSFEEEISNLNSTKKNINRKVTHIGGLEARKNLINESEEDLKAGKSDIDVTAVKEIYSKVNKLIPEIQKSFEETIKFHNNMISEKIKYIKEELPKIEDAIFIHNAELKELINLEKKITASLNKAGFIDELKIIIENLNKNHEIFGKLEEQKRLWEDSINVFNRAKDEINKINYIIINKEQLFLSRITLFNKYFSEISKRIYGDLFILFGEMIDDIYRLKISSVEGNLGTGKKKVQFVAFDLAYINFADEIGVKCLHFILHDQIENIHDNQLDTIFSDIVANTNCQMILPVLSDKLPSDSDYSIHEILTLSQEEKLFKI